VEVFVSQRNPMLEPVLAPLGDVAARPSRAPKVARTRAFEPGIDPVRPRRRGIQQPVEDEPARKALEERISSAMLPHAPEARLALAVTDNRFTMISVKREKGLFRLRLHHMFLDASVDIVRALGRYVARNDRDASQLLAQYIDVNHRKIRRARRRRPTVFTIETRGEVHDLKEIYDDINARYFAGRIDARITWSQRALPNGKRRRRNSIKMGSYSVEDRLIRIHASLDRPFVPRMFVEWIVYHEMLHQKHDIPVVGGRRLYHTPEFLAEEATYPHFERMSRWERENLDKILNY
jgi:predicted metal-dependent hydrolase